MKANAKKSDISRKQILARSIPAFFLHYLILLAIILVFMIYYDPRDWMTYVQKNLNVLFYMIVCIFLLFIAIYGYYFSERRETLVSFKKIIFLPKKIEPATGGQPAVGRVRISGSDSVTSTVCSIWQLGFPSAV